MTRYKLQPKEEKYPDWAEWHSHCTKCGTKRFGTNRLSKHQPVVISPSVVLDLPCTECGVRQKEMTIYKKGWLDHLDKDDFRQYVTEVTT